MILSLGEVVQVSMYIVVLKGNQELSLKTYLKIAGYIILPYEINKRMAGFLQKTWIARPFPRTGECKRDVARLFLKVGECF